MTISGYGPSTCIIIYHFNDIFLYLFCPFSGFPHHNKMYLSPFTLYLSFLKDILTKDTISVCSHVFLVQHYSADWDIFQSKAQYRVVPSIFFNKLQTHAVQKSLNATFKLYKQWVHPFFVLCFTWNIDQSTSWHWTRKTCLCTLIVYFVKIIF